MRARHVALALTAASGVMAPDSSGAQAVFSISPSVVTTQVYDSNLFSSSTARETDLITRVTPRVLTTYRSPIWQLRAMYSFDVERFASHDHLSSGDARRHAATEFEYRPSGTVAISGGADLVTTKTPGELNAGTGLSLTRASASRISGYAGLKRRSSPLNVVTTEYRFSEDRITGANRVRHHTGTAGVERQTSQRDTVRASYRLQHYSFGITSTTSHALNLGWTRGFTPRTAVSIQGGPNFSTGSPTLDFAVTFRDLGSHTERSVTYARGQTTVIGLPGLVQTQSLTASVPWGSQRSVTLTLLPAVYRNEHLRLRADVFRLSLSAVHSVTRSLALEALITASVQHGNLYSALAPQAIPRHEALVRLVAALPAPAR